VIGSRLYTSVKSARKFITEKFPTDWKLYDGGHVVHWPDNMSPYEMQKQTLQALKNFYSRHNMVKFFLSGKITDFRTRQMGHSILKKWEAQNKYYLKKLRQDQISSESLIEPTSSNI